MKRNERKTICTDVGIVYVRYVNSRYIQINPTNVYIYVYHTFGLHNANSLILSRSLPNGYHMTSEINRLACRETLIANMPKATDITSSLILNWQVSYVNYAT